jgi:hypothetical protein
MGIEEGLAYRGGAFADMLIFSLGHREIIASSTCSNEKLQPPWLSVYFREETYSNRGLRPEGQKTSTCAKALAERQATYKSDSSLHALK